MAVGKVFLVGAGPGDPGLITVRGADVLSRADHVLTDALAHPALLELCEKAQIHWVGKRYGEDSAAQEAINRELVALASAGHLVVRLKGGDPLLFARGGEEALALLDAGIPFEVVPGIASPVAASAYAGIPLTHRELSKSVTFITGSDRAGKEWSEEGWTRLATATDTLCILMGMRRIEEITQALLRGGRAPTTPAAVVQWGTRPEQRAVTGQLENIAQLSRERGLKNPAVILVGDVVQLRSRLAWFDVKPLFGKRLFLPRPAQQAKQSARAIRERGAEPVVAPLIQIAPPPDAAPLERALETLSEYSWVVFTSSNGVDRFFAALHQKKRDARALGAARVAVIGPKTRDALLQFGIHADVVASEFVGEGLARDMIAASAAAGGREPKKVLIARALVARDALPNALRDAGFWVNVVPVYETRPVPDAERERVRELLQSGGIDVALFTSSSTVSETLEVLGAQAQELLSRVTVASIGPITSKTLSEAGIRIDVTAREYTVEGLLDALESHFAASSSAA